MGGRERLGRRRPAGGDGGTVSNLVYLIVAVGLSVLGSVLIWYRTRRPRSMEYELETFKRELDAIAPERHDRD